MKRILTMLTASLLLTLTAASAQERGGHQNDFTAAVTVGYNASVMQSAQPGNQYFYSIAAPSTNWNDKSLGVGVELGWFFVDLWRVNIGGGFSFTVDGLLPYVGIKAGYAYGQDIAFKDDETWMGQSAGEAFNIRGAVTVGVDYYITEAFFIGASVDPFAYTYCYSMVQPQAGLGALASDSHNYSAFAAPTIKIGFCF